MTTEDLITYIKSAHPEMVKELIYATDICIDTSVACKTRDPNTILRIFLGTKFHEILKYIYNIHHEHTTKPRYINPCSLGPVPLWKLCQIRAKMNLSAINNTYDNDDFYC
jgi:hypothetical protein